MGVGKTLAPIFYVRINGVCMDKNIVKAYVLELKPTKRLQIYHCLALRIVLLISRLLFLN